MSDGRNKEHKEKPEGQSIFEEAANKEAREKAIEREKKEEQVQQESVQKRTGSRLEMMGMTLYSPDHKTAEEVKNIDISAESDEEIQSSLELLGTISISILAKMFEGGIEKNSVDSLPEFKHVLKKIEREGKYKKIREKISNVSERSAFLKLQKILDHPSSKIYKELEKHWSSYIKKSKSVIEDAEKGHLAEAWKYVKKNPGKVVFAVAGAFALHGLYKAFISEEQSGKAEGKEWHKKIFNKSTGMALGLMAMGAILDSDKIMAFAKEYLSGDAKENAIRAAENAQQAAVDALNRDINFDEKKNLLAKLLGKDSKILESTTLSAVLDDLEIQPEKTAQTEPFKGAGGAAKLIKKWLKKKGKLTPTIEKILDKFIGEDETPNPKSEKYPQTEIEKKESIQEEAEKMVKEQGPLELLIELYCYNSIEISASDKQQIRASIEIFREKKVSEVLAVWEKHKHEKTIPNSNTLGIFEDGIEEKNILRAVEIVAKTAIQYQKRSKKSYENITVEEFLEHNVSNDPVSKVHNAVQQSFLDMIEDGDIGDIFSFKTLNLDRVRAQLKESVKEGWKELARDFGIEIDTLNEKEKKELALIIAHLQLHANLTMDWETIKSQPKFPKVESQKALESSKKFFENVRENTTKNIIPSAKKRFNLGKEDVRNPRNADIINDNLSNNLDFAHALYLNIVTRKMELSQSAESSNGPQELAFLFTVLSSLAEKDKIRYMSELLNIISEKPDKFPSLKMLAPYIQDSTDFAISYLDKQAESMKLWLSALMVNRSPEEQEKFMTELSKKPFLSWETQSSLLKEGAGGALAIGWEVISPMIESGKITLEEVGQCEDPWDIIMLIKKAGGTLLYTKDEYGNPHGLIHIAGEIFVFRPFGTVKDTFDAMLDNEGTQRLTGAFQVWTAGVAPFVVYGAAKGYLMAKWSQKGWLMSTKLGGAARGAADMFAFYPYRALKATYKASKFTASSVVNFPKAAREYAGRPGQVIRRAKRGAMDFVKYRTAWPGQNVPNMLENGKNLAKYIDSSDFVQMDWKAAFQNLKNAEGRTLLLKRLERGFDNNMVIRYSYRFAKDYNDFFKFDKMSEQRLLLADILSGDAGDIEKMTDQIGGEIGRALKGYERTKTFMEHTQKNSQFFDDLLSVAKQGLSRPKQAEAITKIFKEAGQLEDDEIRALVRQLKGKDDIIQFQDRIQSGYKIFSEASDAGKTSRFSALKDYATKKFKNADIRKKVQEKLKRESPDIPEKSPTKAAGETAEVLKNTRKNLETIRKEIRAAESEIKALNDIRKSPQFEGWNETFEKRLTKARQVIADGRAAELKMQESIKAFENVQEIEGKLAKAITHAPDNVSALNKELQSAKKLAEESLQESTELTKNIGKAGKLGRALKYGGTALGGFGAVISFYQAGSAGYEAFTTDVEGRSTVKGVEAGLWTLNAAADTAAVAVLLGAEGAAATGLSAVALPLIPVTYVGVNAIEAAYEETITDYEWAQKNPYEALHHFYTSINTISVGDIYLSAARLDVKEGLDEHHKTMHKIYRGLVAMQKDPSLLNYILDVKNRPPSPEKDKEIERRIDENYSMYHEMYFQSLNPYGIQNYQKAQQVVLDAQMFDRIMTMRDKAKEAGQPFILGNEESDYSLNLCDEEFDMIGGTMAPSFKESAFRPQTIVDKYKEDLTHLMKKDEILWTNLERMDTAYLLRLCVQMQITMSEKDPSLEEDMASLMSMQFMTIKNYLEAQRGVNFEFGIRNASLFEPRMSTDEIMKTLKGLGSGDMKSYLDFEKQNYNPTPATHSLFRLAEYLGYSGEPTEIALKGFFSEGSASFRGIYWDGENWYLQERGHEFDDNLGPNLNEAMIKQVIKYMRENPDDILEHRNDAIFLDAKDYTKEVKNMAQVLEDGLAEGKQRGYKEAKEASKSTPPTNFKEKTVDYEKKEQDLATEYKEAINHVKDACNWSRLKYRVVDDNTIELSRTDSNTSVKLNRSGNEWNVGGYKGGLTLSQAIVLGNLKNKVEKIIVENDHTGGSNAPFQNDGGSVDFDRNWNPNDLRILDHEKGWLGFYDEVGISVDDVVETLNNWYQKR